jgi:hypothetical protein
MDGHRLIWASFITGLLALAGFLIGLSDPAYYDPVTTLDYIASVLNDLGLLAAGATLIIWSRVTPVRRAWLFILGAGIGMILWSIGNALGEIGRLDFGDTVYFVGSIGGFGLTAAAGVVTMTAPSRWRWSGLFLLGISVGIGFDSIPIWPFAWLGFAYVLGRGLMEEPAQSRVTKREPPRRASNHAGK